MRIFSKTRASWRLLTFASLIIPLSSGAELSPFEVPPPLTAGEFLPPELISGPSWTVEEAVMTDGLTATFIVATPYGSWQALGSLRVPPRIRQAEALAQLEQVSKSDVFLSAVKNSVTAPLDLISAVSKQPVETAKAIPKSVGRWFQTTSFKLSESRKKSKDQSSGEESPDGEESSSAEESAAAAEKYTQKFLKITSAERKWYARLEVDPYNDNETLHTAVSSVAKVEGLTSFAMKLAPIPKLPGQTQIKVTMNLVWETDPWELRRRNREILLEAGIDEDDARAFENNPELSPTVQTALIEALRAIPEVTGRGTIIARAIDTQSRDQAEFLVWSTLALLRLREAGLELTELLPETYLPVASTEAGELVAAVPSDAMFWTEYLATAAVEFTSAYADYPATLRTFRVYGRVSERCREGFEQLGWQIIDNWKNDN